MSMLNNFATKISAGLGAAMNLISIASNAIHSTGVTGTLPVEGTIANDGVDDASFPIKIGTRVRAVLSAYTDGDRATVLSDLYGRLRVVTAAFDAVDDAIRTSITNTESSKRSYNVVVDVTNGADGTYDYYLNLDDMGSLSMRYAIDGGTAGAFAGLVITFWASIQDDGTADSSLVYEDVTTQLIGAASLTVAAGASATGLIIDDGGFLHDVHVLRVRVVSVSSGGNTADWKFTARQRVRN